MRTSDRNGIRVIGDNLLVDLLDVFVRRRELSSQMLYTGSCCSPPLGKTYTIEAVDKEHARFVAEPVRDWVNKQLRKIGNTDSVDIAIIRILHGHHYRIFLCDLREYAV